MKEEAKAPYSIRRIGGYLPNLVPIVDGTGKTIYQALTPFMVELRPRGVMQIIVGASMLAVPVGSTEETWSLGESL